MLDTPLPCTKLTGPYTRQLLHYSVSLRSVDAIPGQAGIALCGKRNVVDQERATQQFGPRIRLHELRPCANCRRSLEAMDLLVEARAALAALIYA